MCAYAEERAVEVAGGEELADVAAGDGPAAKARAAGGAEARGGDLDEGLGLGGLLGGALAEEAHGCDGARQTETWWWWYDEWVGVGGALLIRDQQSSAAKKPDLLVSHGAWSTTTLVCCGAPQRLPSSGIGGPPSLMHVPLFSARGAQLPETAEKIHAKTNRAFSDHSVTRMKPHLPFQPKITSGNRSLSLTRSRFQSVDCCKPEGVGQPDRCKAGSLACRGGQGDDAAERFLTFGLLPGMIALISSLSATAAMARTFWLPVPGELHYA